MFFIYLHQNRKLIEEKTKVPRPILTQDAKDIIEGTLLSSLLSKEEILITYYENGHVLTNYMIVIHINPINQTVVCTNAFYNKNAFKFIDIIDAK
ncbi:YolD-like family protein [Bacillus sp. DX1.1]|uniref:YolD-like family protein n=1 Tax=unclassified Bacillus (in: firmicutes) TaxID=185979 RepID=UPI002571077F|nr:MULTISPECIES: YolD-like family protein [unclassified Bacillus (in: firmicutes)]MDM5152657.1 YolD-like family protein [Bacillus sp. DX1.1]WJE84270.1 YolD-like family protein [Bacillus sp. DX3.1]